jgi:hypothetical protein
MEVAVHGFYDVSSKCREKSGDLTTSGPTSVSSLVGWQNAKYIFKCFGFGAQIQVKVAAKATGGVWIGIGRSVDHN